MKPTSARWLALGLSTAVGATALALFVDARRAREGPDLTIAEGDLEAARAALERERAALDPTAGADPARPWLAWPYHLPESVARELLPELASELARYDPWCGYAYVPHHERTRDWDEHPAGRYTKRTSAQGFVGAREPAADPPAVRVVVTGDSHVDGVCAPDEAYPALLEAELRERYPGEPVEVLNAAVSGYSFFQYLGTLERVLHLGLAPDAFVVTVFGGNDFTGLLHLWRFLELGPGRPADTDADRQRQVRLQRKAPREFVPPYGQCLASASYLHSFPDETEVVLDAARRLTGELAARCAEAGVALVIVFLPSPSELPGQCDHARILRAAEYAGLTAEDLARLAELREGYVDGLAASDVPHVDLYPIFAAHDGPLFWRRDLHLNLEGHRLAARAVAPVVEQVLGR